MKKSFILIGIILLAGIFSCVSTGDTEAVAKDEKAIMLSAPDATLTTDMDLVLEDKPEMDNIGWWSSLNDIISWDFEVVDAGTYTVFINLSCDTQFPGSLVEVRVGGQNLQFEVPDTITWSNYFDKEIGTVDLEPGSYTLEVQGIELSERFFANVRYVKLVLM